MGSEIMILVVEQIGERSTNPEKLSPSTSRPIEQVSATVSTNSQTSKPIEQRLELETAEVSGASTSKPLEQREGATFNKGLTSPDDCFIEQKNAERNTENIDTPIEQQVYVTADLRETAGGFSQVEQRDLSRDDTGAEPIEQVAKILNTIDLTQFDFAELIFPACDSVKNPVTTDILWRIRDFGFDFDVETLIFTVDGSPVQDSSNFSITAIDNGLQLDYDPPENFDFGAQVQITLTISDTADPPNDFFYSCVWDTVEDTRPPVIELVSPECNETGVDVREPVVFTVFDAGAGVDQDTIAFAIEGITVCSGLEFDAITTTSGSGFTVTYTHNDDPFRFDTRISVSVSATDLAELQNSSLFVCCFQTEESSVPEFDNWDPAQCASFVDNTTGLSFEVYGDVDGIDISTLEVRIDNKLRTVLVRPRVLRSE